MKCCGEKFGFLVFQGEIELWIFSCALKNASLEITFCVKIDIKRYFFPTNLASHDEFYLSQLILIDKISVGDFGVK